MRQNLFAAAFAIAIVAPVAWMAMDREPPVERVSGEIIPEKPSPGSLVQVKWAVKVNRVCGGTVSRRIVDSVQKLHILDNDPTFYGQGDQLRRLFYIPFGVAYGPARYRAIVRYTCNPLHHWWPITVEGPEVVFEIVPPAAEPGTPGPAGPAGPTGPTGPAGPTGPQGSPG